MAKPKVVSIFSGAGGFDIGFRKAGFKIVFSSDNWETAVDTLKQNKERGQEITCQDVSEIDFKAIKFKHKKIDVLIGGPPCPPFSKSRFYRENLPRSLDDVTATHTLSYYFNAVEILEPETFVFENVPGFVYKTHKEAKEFFDGKLQELGYDLVFDRVINCANYGVPQIRERFFAIAKKKSIKQKFVFPEQTHIDPKKHNQLQGDFLDKCLSPWVICKEAISEFDHSLESDQEAGSKHKNLLKKIPPGDNYLFFTKERGHRNPKFIWRSRYWSFLLKLSPDKPSWTIQASFSNNQGPFHWTNRFLRIAEIKRIQTFPDDYVLSGDFKDQWRQVGNAVPPLMAEVIAKALKKQFLFK